MVTTEKMAYSPLEASQSLGLSLATVYKLLRERRLMGVRIERKILIPRSELEKLLNTRQPAERN